MNRNIFTGVLGCTITAITILHQPLVAQEFTEEQHATETVGKKTGSFFKPYAEIIPAKAVSQKGFFTVHQVADKYYFEVPRTLEGREVLLVVRTARTGGGAGYGGESLSESLFRWERASNGKQIFLRVPNKSNIVNPKGDLFPAFQNSFIEPIWYAFDIKAFGPDSAAIIDVTELYAKDALAFGIAESKKNEFKLGNLEENKSYIESVKAFPFNIEFSTLKTYKRSGKPGNEIENSGYVTLEIHYSMLLLPEKPMMPRLYDNRVGIFSQKQDDFSIDQQRVKTTVYTRRWKLEPSDPEAFRRGELVDPIQPIVFYIDPATPDKWKPYFKQAVEDWQPAFEAAGFKNAIIAKDAPTPAEDPTWDPMDARHSMICYFASKEKNSYGPHVADPRSGEILEAHVGIYHNILDLVSTWYAIQTGAANPNARSAELSDETIGALYRQVVCHEVGHSLGLAHNFAGSSAIPVDSLRSPSFTDHMGTSASIMDYARYNYVAQPGDGVRNFIPKVGPYDLFVINWAYRPILDAQTPQAESETLNRWIQKKTNDRNCKYLKQKVVQTDPRGQAEDLGDDVIKANTLALKNMRYIVANFDKWIAQPGENFNSIQNFYDEIIRQWIRYMGHAITYISGVYEDYKVQGETGPVYTPVSKEKQREALRFLDENAFHTPDWLLRKDLFAQFDASGNYEKQFRNVQAKLISDLLRMSSLSRMIETQQQQEENYKVSELLQDIRALTFQEIYTGKPLNPARRALQRIYIDELRALVPTQKSSDKKDAGSNIVLLNDLKPVVKIELETLCKEVKRACTRYQKGSLDRAHLELIEQSTTTALQKLE